MKEELIERAKNAPARIIFPEGEDERIKEAVKEITALGIAHPIVFGFRKEVDTKGVEIVDPLSEEIVRKYSAFYTQVREKKGVSLDAAVKLLTSNPVFTAALMVREGFADALIAGASHTTKDVAKAVIYCIGPQEGKSVSSCFIIDTGNEKYGYKGKFIFADCGVIVEPTSEQLAGVAVDSGMLFQKIFSTLPHIAFLSYSTYGSAGGPSVERVRRAVEIVKEIQPELMVDGELQADAAIVPEVASRKCPDSPVAGKANVLIFPDLNSGNICYKLVDKLMEAVAVGPIFLGTARPASDLSRGCEVEEIVLDAAVISIMAQFQNEEVRS
ncbi:MAG: phosphate acetyltransferase [Candidatus Omnitrophota bacterium]|nr:MAG: phosphate acetyltransferase [Candidatus Omnitrophota bacterium]